jgi:hypothetical protein
MGFNGLIVYCFLPPLSPKTFFLSLLHRDILLYVFSSSLFTVLETLSFIPRIISSIPCWQVILHAHKNHGLINFYKPIAGKISWQKKYCYHLMEQLACLLISPKLYFSKLLNHIRKRRKKKKKQSSNKHAAKC